MLSLRMPTFFIIMLLFAATAFAETPRDPYSHFFNETFGDFSEELENARNEGKKGIMIFFEMDECPFCHYMKGNVLNQPSVQAYYREHFLLFPVDIEGDVGIVNFEGEAMTQKEWAKRSRVRATPVIAFYDLNGKRVHRHISKTSGVEEFMLMGEFVADGHYQTMKFTPFKKQHKKQ